MTDFDPIQDPGLLYDDIFCAPDPLEVENRYEELLAQYHIEVLELADDYGDNGFASQVGRLFGQPEGIEIDSRPRNLGNVVIDGQIPFGVAVRPAGFSAVVGSMSLTEDLEPVIVQLQAVKGREGQLTAKWPFLLVGIAEEIARRNGASSIAILPAEKSIYYPTEGEERHYHFRTDGRSFDEVRNGLRLRYNATARRAGYRKGTDGLYRKSLVTPQPA